tara:strand:- start:16964 stop:19690 length:2727 start_codon:yes stop_codon:yes gene_type:complete
MHTLTLFVLLTLLGTSSFAQNEIVLHVATDGNDNWSGLSSKAQAGDGPLRTLLAAQRTARQALDQQRRFGGSVKVLIHPGIYEIDAPLIFDQRDSGLPGKPTVYQASEPGTVTISGGKRLLAQGTTGKSEVVFSSNGTNAGFWTGGPQLYVNGRRAILAREPNIGRDWFVGQAVAVPGESPSSLGHEAFIASKPALSFLNGLSASDRERALIHIMQSWSSGRHRIGGAAPEGSLRVTPRSRWPFLFFGTSQRFYVENVTAALDQPGEWVGVGTDVHYLPRPDDDVPLNAVLPYIGHLLIIRGAGPTGPYVENVAFRDLGFAYTQAPTPANGWVDTQAAVDIGAAIQVDFAHNIAILGCRIESTGGYGIWLRDSVRNSTISGCSMRNLGAGGVKIGTPKIAGAAPSTVTGENTVSDNTIMETGGQFPGAVGIWLGQTFDNIVRRNSIRDTTYTGISVGWQWGYSTTTSGRNQIVGNSLLNIGRGRMSDLGGIYTLGPSPGTVIADNLIREVRGYRELGAGAWGIYNDEGSSDILVENNVVIGTDSGAYHLHYGRNIQLKGNVFAQGDGPEVSLTRSDPEKTRLILRGNLLLTGNAQPFSSLVKPPDAYFFNNLIAPLANNQVLDLKSCAEGCERSSAGITLGRSQQQIQFSGVNPDMARRWIEAAANAGAPGAPPAALGAATKNAGVKPSPITAKDRARLSASASADSLTPAEAPQLQVTLDLISTPEGARPAGWRYLPEMPREAMEVVADSTARGQRCLKFSDSPKFEHGFEPYMFVRLNHAKGTSTASFSIRVDESAEFIHEWRDDAAPYRTGPSLRITRKGVEAAGRLIAPVRPGEWLSITVSAAVDGLTGWNIRITDSEGESYSATALPHKAAGWRGLRWLGFISNAVVTSATCLASASVTSDAR